VRSASAFEHSAAFDTSSMSSAFVIVYSSPESELSNNLNCFDHKKQAFE
jgi:hypothetical protein